MNKTNIHEMRKRGEDLAYNFSLVRGEGTTECPMCGIDLNKIADWIDQNYTSNTEVQKEREEAVRGVLSALGKVLKSEYIERIKDEVLKTYLAQTKGGKDE